MAEPLTPKGVTDIVLETRRAFSDLADYAEAERERANLAESRLRLARNALVATGYFSEEQVGDDVAPRIIELHSFWSSKDVQQQRKIERILATRAGLSPEAVRDAHTVDCMGRAADALRRDGWLSPEAVRERANLAESRLRAVQEVVDEHKRHHPQVDSSTYYMAKVARALEATDG